MANPQYYKNTGCLVYVAIIITITMFACRFEPQSPPPPKVWKPIVVKKKYSENSVTKDIVFGTGNWHSTDYYIVDKNNKIWNNISKENYILCDVGDTLWTNDGWRLELNKK